jgi:hypothetical protein
MGSRVKKIHSMVTRKSEQNAIHHADNMPLAFYEKSWYN